MVIDKIVMFSPLPPSKTGIADYMAEVGMELEKKVEITYVIADGALLSEYKVKNGNIVRYSDFKGMLELQDIPRIYQMGNNLQHEYILFELLKSPGIVVLHDYSLHHLFVALTLARGNETDYKELMTYNYDDYGELVAQGRSCGEFNELLQFILPLNQTVMDASLAIVVHSHESFFRARKVTDHKKIHKIDFPYNHEQDAMLTGSVRMARNRLGIDENTIIFASFGFVTPPKQIEFVIEALSKIKNDISNFKYLIIGEVSDSVPIKQILAEYDLKDSVEVLGFVDLEKLHLYMEATDIVVSLRYPSAGETSAALYRAMGIGKCCLAFDYSSYSDLPDNTLIKIRLDTFDTTELAKSLKHYARHLDEVVMIAENAKQYILEKHSVEICANQYMNIIKKVY
jgi:glycosyltransferase involved in cell wall biosynthesis